MAGALVSRFGADFTSFLDAVQKAQVSLRKFEEGGEKVAASLTKMGNSFSGTKIISDATIMTKAIENAGGASTLTAKEMERVNSTLNEAIAKYKALGGVAPQTMVDLANATKRAEEPTTSLNLSFGKLVASYVTAQAVIGAVKGAFGALVGEIQSSITAASEAEKADVQMVAALRAQGTAVPSVIDAFRGYADALQQTTVFQDDAIQGSIALLVQVGNVMPRDMKKALDATTNLASGLGKDLTSATMLVAKAAEGNTAALKKAGVVIDEVKAKQEGFGYVLDKINEKFAGQAAAIAGTYQGRLEQLANTWNNVEESIGRVITQNATILRAFDLLNQMVATNTRELKENSFATNLVSDAVILAVRGVALLARGFDVAQTWASAFFISLRSGGAALGNIGIAMLEVVKASALLAGNVSLYRLANEGIAPLAAAVAELGRRNDVTTQRSAAFGNALAAIESKATGLAADLATTRGKVVELAPALDTTTGAWDRHTKAVTTAKETVVKIDAAYAALLARLDAIQGPADDAKVKTLELAKGLELVGKKAPLPELKDLSRLSLRATSDVAALGYSVDELGRKGVFGAAELGDLNKQILLLPNVVPGGTKAIKDATTAVRDETSALSTLSNALGSLSNDFVQMAQIAGGSWGGPLKAIGETIKSVEMVAKGIHQINAAMEEMQKPGGMNASNLSALAAGWAGLVVVIAEVVMAYKKATDEAQNLNIKLNVIEPALRNYFQTNITFSDQLYQSLLKLPIALNMSGLIKELGGESKLTAFQVERMYQAFRQAFDLIAQGGPQSQAAIEEINKTLLQIGEAAIEAGGLVSKMFLAFEAQARTTGVESKALNTFMLDQLKSGAEGLNAIFIGLQASATASAQKQARLIGKLTDEEIKNLVGVFKVTKEQGEGLAAAVAADFAEMVERGMSFKDALEKLAPSIEILRKALVASGVDGGEAFKFLSILAETAADPINGPLLDAIAGVNNALKGLYNSGILNQKMFAGLTTTAGQAFANLIKNGVDANVAMTVMAPTLQTIWQLWKDQGFAIDDATKKLLEEAEAQGLVGDKHRDVASQMLIATKEIRDAVRDLARAFGVDLPENAEEAARRIGKSMQDAGKFVNDLTKAVGTPPGGSGGGGGGGAEGAATGGIVTSTGIQHFGRGGMVLPFRPRGTDTVPAMLTPGEMVLTRAQQRRLLNGGGRDVVIHTHVEMDGRETARALTRVAV